jgi:dTDP-4-dehydrorhamnose 3,5-epimerase-like enzyme|tara:strand:+ start:405 stop:806 length:402 start_codon:yes stop_codon:yes gene_type:complete
MKKYKFKQFKKSSGTLVPFSLKKQIPFRTKRMFIIYGNKNFLRGNHAHFKCSQFLVPIYGTMTIDYENKNLKKKIKINYKKKQGLLLKPKTWCKIKFESNHSILMVFCDREYEYNDYIENYSEFLNIIKKNKI